MTKGGLIEAGESSKVVAAGANRGIAIMDLILRIGAVGATLASAVSMGTSEQQLPFFTRFLIFSAQYDDFPTLAFFVIVNAIACGYFALSIPISILHIGRSRARKSRIILIFMDTAMLGLLSAAASAAAAIIYLAHAGNASANWLAICQQFNDFCKQTSGALIGSFGAIVVLVLLIIMSATALSRV